MSAEHKPHSDRFALLRDIIEQPGYRPASHKSKALEILASLEEQLETERGEVRRLRDALVDISGYGRSRPAGWPEGHSVISAQAADVAKAALASSPASEPPMDDYPDAVPGGPVTHPACVCLEPDAQDCPVHGSAFYPASESVIERKAREQRESLRGASPSVLPDPDIDLRGVSSPASEPKP